MLTEEDDRIFYSPGHVLAKAQILLRNYLQRWRDLKRAKDFDIIFIFREALMTRETFFEKRFARSGAKIIYDFDDAIWMNDTSAANRLFKWMKNPEKIARSIGYADLVFAGNYYLKTYAEQFNNNVTVVPTTIDTAEYARVATNRQDFPVVIGWSGSLTTIKHFQLAIPFLLLLKEKYGDRIQIKVIGDAAYRNEELGITGVAWSKSNEIVELGGIDIGIMPLPDDPWAQGKCGLKGLQYMAFGIPAVMSPVGVNTEIIEEGKNGFLANSHQEWVEKLSILIDQKELRQTMGENARKTVEERYSVKANQPVYLHWFKTLTDG